MEMPSNYVCSKCGATGVKLWREYQTFLDHIHLKCLGCSIEEQRESLNQQDIASIIDGRTDQIGWRVAACPTDDGTYWGYTSVPQDVVDWWKNLPYKREI
jgi:hypothetical protein